MPTDSSVQGIPPSHVPAGYEFRRQFGGGDVGGFGRGEDQVALIYTRGWEVEDWNSPLTIHASPAGEGILAGTENRPGEPVDLGIPSATAVYHDGLWAPGSGEDERDLGDVIIHWDRTNAHSITIRASNGTYAVRAPKADVAFDELVEVARSLDLSD